MNFIEINLNMIDEARILRGDVRSGKISFDQYMAQMGGMSQIGKMLDRHIKFLNAERILKVSLRNVEPDLIPYDPEKEAVACPGNQKSIERQQCIDWSGSSKFDECAGCEVGKQTKTLLLVE